MVAERVEQGDAGVESEVVFGVVHVEGDVHMVHGSNSLPGREAGSLAHLGSSLWPDSDICDLSGVTDISGASRGWDGSLMDIVLDTVSDAAYARSRRAPGRCRA
ncbi:hypothetical protein SSP24_12080 [Streptomyces spinoverrucosus]|uniref:Uncharacterized protein n=1 Tax=Streptomyces spinoverrucosus TaxID=284043 RepID=A0A4Y3VB11_9ACTN|nr:hypothetical protein SSP24_12080 [Streptomyces spinoverrucosus]GHB34859.1 hypothetical protein GCM10010397_00480 [Streptomyces spinoverrucosus]